MYNGVSLKKEKLSLWTQKHISVLRKSGPQGHFKELGKSECTADKDTNFYLLWLRGGDLIESSSIANAMRDLSNTYRTDPVRIRWVSVEQNPQIATAFALLERKKVNSFILYRPKRGRYKVFGKEVEDADLKSELKSFVDSAVFDGAALPLKVENTISSITETGRQEL